MRQACLEITLLIDNSDRDTAAGIYSKYNQLFLTKIKGAVSKELLIRTDDVQVLHGFDTIENAIAYLNSQLFTNHVVIDLKPLLKANTDIRIYSVV